MKFSVTTVLAGLLLCQSAQADELSPEMAAAGLQRINNAIERKVLVSIPDYEIALGRLRKQPTQAGYQALADSLADINAPELGELLDHASSFSYRLPDEHPEVIRNQRLLYASFMPHRRIMRHAACLELPGRDADSRWTPSPPTLDASVVRRLAECQHLLK